MVEAEVFELLQSEQILLYSEDSSRVSQYHQKMKIIILRVLLKIVKKMYKVIIV